MHAALHTRQILLLLADPETPPCDRRCCMHSTHTRHTYCSPAPPCLHFLLHCCLPAAAAGPRDLAPAACCPSPPASNHEAPTQHMTCSVERNTLHRAPRRPGASEGGGTLRALRRTLTPRGRAAGGGATWVLQRRAPRQAPPTPQRAAAAAATASAYLLRGGGAGRGQGSGSGEQQGCGRGGGAAARVQASSTAAGAQHSSRAATQHPVRYPHPRRARASWTPHEHANHSLPAPRNRPALPPPYHRRQRQRFPPPPARRSLTGARRSRGASGARGSCGP